MTAGILCVVILCTLALDSVCGQEFTQFTLLGVDVGKTYPLLEALHTSSEDDCLVRCFGFDECVATNMKTVTSATLCKILGREEGLFDTSWMADEQDNLLWMKGNAPQTVNNFETDHTTAETTTTAGEATTADVAATTPLSHAAYCPAEFTQTSVGCFLVNADDTWVNHNTARTNCEAIPGNIHLASLDTQQKIDAVSALMTQLDVEYVWTGARDVGEKDGVYVFDGPGEDLLETSPLWAPDEPNPDGGESVLYHRPNGGLVVHLWSRNYNYVCEAFP